MKEPATTLLEIFTFGSVRILEGGTPVIGLASRKAEALLIHLAATGRAHPRETLADLLWDDRSQTQAMANLRVLLASLRQQLSPYLQIERHSVGIAPGNTVWLDAREMENALKCHHAEDLSPASKTLHALEGAVGLYKGDFLAGFPLRACREFEYWMVLERERLRQLVIDGLLELTSFHLASRAPRAGLPHARRLLELNPLMESAHCQMMRLLALSGQREAALAQFAACRAILQQELGVEPAAETLALAALIRTGGLLPPPQARNVSSITTAPPQPGSSPAQRPLPRAALPFIDRAEFHTALERLQDPYCQLVTLIGPGGSGKTRLALQAAETLADQFPDGVCFVPLVSVETQEGLAAAIAEAAGFTFFGPQPPEAQVMRFLREKTLLLVLDNFEQIVPAADFLSGLLAAAPQVKLLITSRERLHLQEEWLLDVGGLPVPETEEPGAVRDFAAVRLFLACARRISAAFGAAQLPAAELAAIARICRLVEGAPLAIELAAAWVRVMSCTEIAAAVANSLEALASPLQNAPARHRSMQAVFETSWELLNPAEKQTLRQLAVFRGGFGREAAQAVSGASLATLAALVDKSLLQHSAGRYALHELLRQFAAEKLAARPEEAAEARGRHSHFYAAFLGQANPRLRTANGPETLAEIEAEFENVRQAWDWAVYGAPTPALAQMEQCLLPLYIFYEARNWFGEGEAAFARAAARLHALETESAATRESRLLLGQALARQGWFCWRLQRAEQAKKLFQESLSVLRQVDGRRELAYALQLAYPAGALGNPSEARGQLQEGYETLKLLDDRPGAAHALYWLGNITHDLGADVESGAYFETSRAICAELGHLTLMGHILIQLGSRAYRARNLESAAEHFRASLDAFRDWGYAYGVGLAAQLLGDVLRLGSEYAEADRLYEQSLAAFESIDFQRGIGGLRRSQAELALALGKFQQAELWSRASLAFFEGNNLAQGMIEARCTLGRALAGLGRYDEAMGFSRRALEVARETGEQPILITVLASLSAVFAKGGTRQQKVHAVEGLAFARQHPASLPETQAIASHHLRELEKHLSASEIQLAQERGSGRTLEEIFRSFSAFSANRAPLQ